MHRFRVFAGLLAFLAPLAAAGADDDATADAEAAVLAQGTGREGRLDPTKLAEIRSVLARVRTKLPDLASIRARPPYEIDSLVLVLEEGIDAATLKELERALGSRGAAVSPLGAGLLLLRFDGPRDVPGLLEPYGELPGVARAEPNHLVGDGDEITLIRRGALWHFVFKHGWGDCPSGCIHNHYRYVTYDPRNGSVELVAELPADERPSGSPLWGIPARFSVNAFSSHAAIERAVADERWWVALHAVKVSSFLLTEPKSPMFGEDFEPQGRFEAVRDDVLAHRREAVAELVKALDHGDPDVAAAAHEGLLQNTDRTWGRDAEGRAAWRRWLETR